MIRIYFFIAILSMLMLLSCTAVETETSPGDGSKASVKLNTRGTLNPGDPDSKISSLRVMAFDHSTGAIKSNTLYSGATLNTSIVHTMHSGLYDFFFVANEPSGSTLGAIASLSGLGGVEFQASAFSSDSDIPMTASYSMVTVHPGGQGVTVGGNTYTDWSVTLVRIAVRFDITLQSETDISGTFEGVAFNNLPDAVPLIGGNYSGPHTTTRVFDKTQDPGYFEPATPTGANVWAMRVKRIILPAHVFTPVADISRVTGFVVQLNSGVNPGCTFSLNDATGYSGPENYTMPYNYHFTVSSGIKIPMEINLGVEDWGQVDLDGSTITRKLNVSAVQTNLSERSISRIFFVTDQTEVSVDPVGYTGASGTATFTVNDVFTDLAGASASHLTFDPGTGRGYIDIETDVLSPGTYIHRICLNANGLRREIMVNTVIRPSVDWSAKPYIGTFHRWNEIGERLIFNNNTGGWTASVDGGADSFVILDLTKSYDPNINTENPGSAEFYPLPDGSAYSVSGTGNIYFRVGMKSKLASADSSPRYDRITVTTSSGTFYLYVRQGEAADYIYKQDETGTGTNYNSRPYAVKISPYNLTDPNGTVNTGSVKTDLGYRGYAFTRFPTQAGYYFQWGNTAAWLHDNTSNTVSGWSSVNMPGYWANNQWETCPEGYQRINGGSTSSDVLATNLVDSQVAHSLLFNIDANPQNYTQTLLKGYYADGFFDRRLTTSPNGYWGNEPNSMVGSGAMMAYQGVLVYHKITHASVFFPSGGHITSAYIMYQGGLGLFWTSSASGASSAWAFRLVSDSTPITAQIPNRNRSEGVSVRCVKLN